MEHANNGNIYGSSSACDLESWSIREVKKRRSFREKAACCLLHSFIFHSSYIGMNVCVVDGMCAMVAD